MFRETIPHSGFPSAAPPIAPDEIVRSWFARCGGVTAAAIALTVLSWALIWACGLDLVEFVPQPLAIGVFVAGLALIPLRKPSGSRTPRQRGGWLGAVLVLPAILAAAAPAAAQTCPVNHDQLTQALKASVKPSGGPSNGGFDNNEWAVAVNRDGVVCAVTFSGQKASDQWLASRAIAEEKANAVIGVSLDAFAFSTANLYAGSLPGGYLYGLITTNPAIAGDLHAGDPKTYGSGSDPMVGKIVGGGVVFGGGLPLYDQNGLVGGLGVSGDTSCADHNVAWRVRNALKFDRVPNGISPDHNDAIIYDMLPDKTSASGYGHPQCGGHEAEIAEQIHSGIVPKWAQVMVK